MNWLHVGYASRLQNRRFFVSLGVLVCLLCAIIAQPISPPLVAIANPTGALELKRAETPQVYFAYKDAPLLSFGGMSDMTFYTASDTIDYRRWADWAAAHGMNHIRAYPPFSYSFVEQFTAEHEGSPENILFPYEETQPGSRQFDLTQFNEAYWQRFREQCDYLKQKGIIVHLLMVNGWQLKPGEKNWEGHFFNPNNNVNAFTDGLEDNRLAFYQSVADQSSDLVEAQKRWFEKLVEETADYDNVYYDLVHEMAENYENWEKAKDWIDVMAKAVRDRFTQLQPNRSIILGMDTGGLEDNQRRWIFSRPYFDLLIFGKSHKVEKARAWQAQFKKPYIPQESWDENGDKYSYRDPADRVHLRKYLWKFLMAKCQQMDFYIKPVKEEGQLPGLRHRYDPNGWSPFEQDAVVLRQTWDSLQDYPNLRFKGVVQSDTWKNRYVLSSEREALIYLSSQTGKEAVEYEARSLRVRDLALADGLYKAEIISPEEGSLAATTNLEVSRHRIEVDLPAFVDDLAVHLTQSGDSAAANSDSLVADKNGRGLGEGWGRRMKIGLFMTIAIASTISLGAIFHQIRLSD